MERNCQNNEMEKQPLLPGDREAGEDQEVRENQNVSVQQTDRGDPPDGGRGWIVVIACFFALFTLDGKFCINIKLSFNNLQGSRHRILFWNVHGASKIRNGRK